MKKAARIISAIFGALSILLFCVLGCIDCSLLSDFMTYEQFIGFCGGVVITMLITPSIYVFLTE